MAGVAYNSSTIAESTKVGYVTYDVYEWQVDVWVYVRTDSTGAKINGSVSSASTVYVNGQPIAYVGSATNETWVADPPVPSNTSTTEYRNILPSTSGSGNGSVTGGNLNSVYVGGLSIALIGSAITTHLSTSTTINSGSNSVFIGG